jgi:protein transport protein SEC24
MCRNVIEPLLADLPSRFASSPTHLCAPGAAMRGCLASLVRKGGQAIVFQSSMCSAGPGVSEVQLDETKLYDTDKERQLFMPGNEMWRDLGDEFAEAGIGVSLVVGTGVTSYVGFSSLGQFCSC